MWAHRRRLRCSRGCTLGRRSWILVDLYKFCYCQLTLVYLDTEDREKGIPFYANDPDNPHAPRKARSPGYKALIKYCLYSTRTAAIEGYQENMNRLRGGSKHTHHASLLVQDNWSYEGRIKDVAQPPRRHQTYPDEPETIFQLATLYASKGVSRAYAEGPTKSPRRSIPTVMLL